MSTDISTPRARCLRDCWSASRSGKRGYVRRCEHGRLWKWDTLDDCWIPVMRIELITQWHARHVRREATS